MGQETSPPLAVGVTQDRWDCHGVAGSPAVPSWRQMPGDPTSVPGDALPSFTNPPVREVGVAVMMSGLGVGHVHLGLLWERFRAEYPQVEIKGPVPQQVEFLDTVAEAPGIQFELLDAPPVPRAWFVSSDGTEVVQVQNDRIGFNWRRVTGTEVYPRFPQVRARFEQAIGTVTKFVEDQALSLAAVPVQCEVVYSNEIPAMGALGHGDPDPVLRLWKPVDDVYPGPAEDVRFMTRHRLPKDERVAGGRLIVEVQPVMRLTDSEPVYLLSLTVRGAPVGATTADILSFVDFGHEVIVRAFASITTPGMHEEWGREQ